MILQYICPPASLYLAFSIIQILIDMFRGETTTAFLKFLVMIIFTVALNMLCASGLGIISWFIVFIPFILMTYITTILVFVFGIPKTSDLRPERKHRNEHDRNWWRHHKHIGGCAGTEYGCCDDGQTAKNNFFGTNCPPAPAPAPAPIVGGCAGTQYGCCNDGTSPNPCPTGTTIVVDPNSAKLIGGCAGSQYGCCSDGSLATAKPCGVFNPVI